MKGITLSERLIRFLIYDKHWLGFLKLMTWPVIQAQEVFKN